MPIRKAVEKKFELEQVNLYAVGDTHVGSAACQEDKIKRLVKKIAEDPNGYIIGLGDFIEAISYSDKRFDAGELAQPISPEHVTNPFYTQALRFVKLFEPVKDRFLAVVAGNHEHKALQQSHFDATAIIAERLGCAYLGAADCSGWLRIRLTSAGKVRNTVNIFALHGYGGVNGNKAEQLAGRKDADLIMMGHTHKAMATPATVEYLDAAGQERTKTRWFIVCPPMTDKASYAARIGANETFTGYAKVRITRDHDGRLITDVSLGDI